MTTYLVIGAGILGASTAYHLAKAGVEVTIVDRKDPGQATDAAAGIVCPWLSQRRNKAWYNLAKLGAKYYATLIKELEAVGETNTGYKKVGAICLHSDENKLDKMEERAHLRRADAPEIGEITRLTTGETTEIFPPLSEEFLSVHIGGAARVNGRELRNALIRAANLHGAQERIGSATLVKEGGKLIGVKIEDKILRADKILVTAGVWANELLLPLEVDFQVSSQKAQIVHLGLEDANTDSWPVVMPPNDQYILAFDDGRVVAGATHENEKGMDARVTAGGLHEVLNKALSIAPGLSEGTVIETRVGFRPFTPDFLPVIGVIPGYDNLYVANGLGASGLTVGPFLGGELAKLAMGNELDIDVDLYDINSAIK
ncbi:NAD(P)/FAD-dependent oxidoreductase [Bacillus sp. REN16]|uniref:NAD(P)/FAD-dependent oxidoreductase n=1 Tax=Bacillus sp. REN16 TaxID=2887296 RepID=UPI001E4F33CD|nr:FAD-binding oxidoreductase [Bacillus sp. REN16]MCC3357275.1 FAD-binding oxidoreductase [Bacillus sp. REN16]